MTDMKYLPSLVTSRLFPSFVCRSLRSLNLLPSSSRVTGVSRPYGVRDPEERRMGEGQLEEDFIVLVPWIVRRSFTPGSYYPSVARRAPHVRGELEQEPEERRVAGGWGPTI